MQLDLAEGGVFENEPIRREDVVRADQEAEGPMLSENTVKSSLQRLREIKEEASKVHTSKAVRYLWEQTKVNDVPCGYERKELHYYTVD